MREPAMCCAVCRRALGPRDVFYTPAAEVSCDACFAAAADPAGTPARLGLLAPARTRFERARRLRRWSFLWLGLATASIGAAHVARSPLQAPFPVAIIETPEAWAAVPAELTVRGHVCGAQTQQPLWVVARSGHERGCRGLIRSRVVLDGNGAFGTTLTLAGDRGRRYWLQVVAADEHANRLFETSQSQSWLDPHRPETQGGHGCPRMVELEDGRLPAGARPLASVGVTLAEDSPWWMSSLAEGPMPSIDADEVRALLSRSLLRSR